MRKTLYRKINDFWSDMYGEEYALYDIQTISKEDAQDIKEATKKIGAIFFKTAKLLRILDEDTLISLGFPKETIPYVKTTTSLSESVIARLDLIPTSNGYKCIEINSDTPTFIKELFHVNGYVCDEFGFKNPNAEEFEKLKFHINQNIESAKKEFKKENPHVVFVADEDNIEDFNTAKYLMDFTEYGKLMDVKKLKIHYGLGVFDDEGKKIDILYRQTLPIENLILDKDDEGNPVGEWLLEMVHFNKVKVINPPSAFLLQNKSVMAVIWGLHEELNPFFTKEEHGWISNHFLPTYLELDEFLENNIPFVQKPVFGREGDTVKIFNSGGCVDMCAEMNSYKQYRSVYQKYEQQPIVTFRTQKGAQEGSLLVGSFLIGGEPSSFGFRVGPKITDNMSYYLPVGISD